MDAGRQDDSGQIVADGVNALRAAGRAFLVITHYQRILNYIKPEHVHILVNGRIAMSAGPELALELDERTVDSVAADPDGNLLDHIKGRLGDVDQGLAEADVVIEREYRTPAYEHMFLEPECSIGVPAGYDEQHEKLTVYVGSQIPYADRAQAAAALGVVLNAPCGGEGTCGKCRVQVLDGGIDPLLPEERALLTTEQVESGLRLGCRAA